MARSAEMQRTRDRGDLWSAIIVGALAAAVIVNDAVNTILGMFRTPGAVTVTATVPPQDVDLSIGVDVPATVTTALLTVEGAGTGTIVALVLGAAVTAAALVAAVALGCVFCVRLLRGSVFSRGNTRILLAISMLLLFGPLAGEFLQAAGLNGVFAALGTEFTGRWSTLWAIAPMIFASIAVGVLVIVFRRGERMQRDTEGLV